MDKSRTEERKKRSKKQLSVGYPWRNICPLCFSHTEGRRCCFIRRTNILLFLHPGGCLFPCSLFFPLPKWSPSVGEMMDDPSPTDPFSQVRVTDPSP
ncbi:hypothetical protein CEXT_10921 [Caerostris extrusa]|uniref:Uncharacterized protein n=1 Tax=Caerostris extrusa TaxID=172846 RepID=A0AAV4NR11_CAEEX|nr:hypothetical protein CEXT_10921 [Caerostris extrusa]